MHSFRRQSANYTSAIQYNKTNEETVENNAPLITQHFEKEAARNFHLMEFFSRFQMDSYHYGLIITEEPDCDAFKTNYRTCNYLVSSRWKKLIETVRSDAPSTQPLYTNGLF